MSAKERSQAMLKQLAMEVHTVMTNEGSDGCGELLRQLSAIGKQLKAQQQSKDAQSDPAIPIDGRDRDDYFARDWE